MQKNIYSKSLLGKLGEHLVMSEFLKAGINGIIVGDSNLRNSPDILLENNIGIEVKTSIYGENRFQSSFNKLILKGSWSFTSIKKNNADFVVFVLLNNDYRWNYFKPTQNQLAQRTYGPIRTETSLGTKMSEEIINIVMAHPKMKQVDFNKVNSST